MKRKGIHLSVVIILLISTWTGGLSQNTDYPKLSVNVDPAGFLFFGPSLNLGWSYNESLVINFNVHRNSWGLLLRGIRASDFPDLYSISGMGYALGSTRFVKNVEEGIYYGAFLVYDIQRAKYSENSAFAWHEQFDNYGVLFNAGKRFKLGSKFYFNAGVVLGGALVKSQWDYDDPSAGIDDLEDREGTSFIPVGSLELAIGMFLF